jgi:hypothetical protein
MSEYRVEKRRLPAELTLTSGPIIHGCFFLGASSATHAGPERVVDLLNGEKGFFPFELTRPAGGAAETVLYNRAHVAVVKLADTIEAQLDPGYDVATERRVWIRLSTGTTVAGTVRVFQPMGRDRLSDYARSPDTFRYIEAGSETFVVNMEHVVELRQIQ